MPFRRAIAFGGKLKYKCCCQFETVFYAPYGLASRPELPGTAFVHDAYIRATSPFGMANYTLQTWGFDPLFSGLQTLNWFSEPFYSAEQARSFLGQYPLYAVATKTFWKSYNGTAYRWGISPFRRNR